MLFDELKIIPYLQVIASGFLLTPITATIVALLRRDMAFVQVSVITFLGTVVGAIATLSFAFADFSYMSFAWGAIAAHLATTVAALAFKPSPLIFVPLLQDWKEIVRFGWISAAMAVMNRVYEIIPAVALGRLISVEAVGLFNRAQMVAQIPDKTVAMAVAPVALPALSIEAREGRLKASYLTALQFASVVQWPLFGLLALLAHPVVMFILGNQWVTVVPLVQILALAGMLTFPSIFSFPILVATGHIEDTLKSSMLSLPPSIIGISIAANFGALAVAMSQVFAVALQVAVVLTFIRQRLSFSWLELLLALRSSFLVATTTLIATTALLTMHGSLMRPSSSMAMVTALMAVGIWLAAVRLLEHPIDRELRVIWRSVSQVIKNRILW